jgi:DNA-binding MarR family transcriptional regulator
MPDPEYVHKAQAVSEIMQATKYSKYIVERKMDELEKAGQIQLYDDPGDQRKRLISKEHVQAVINALRVKAG